jgi:phosphate transport system substrate-binding protein
MVSSTLNNWTDCLNPNELNKIWNAATAEKIVNWQQINSRYPDVELNLLGSAPDSSTYDYFTTTIVGNNNRIRDDYVAYQDNRRIVREVANNRGSLGFIDFSLYAKYADRNVLKPLRISNENNRCVKPNSISIADGSYNFLSRPLFIYARKTALQEHKNIQVLIEYILAPENSFTISEVGYVPLPQEVLEKVRIRLDKMTTGSIFAGQSAAGVRLFDRL